MSVIGFSFTKFVAERHRATEGKLNISNNISIVDVNKKELLFGKSKHPGLKFGIQLKVSYTDEKKVSVADLLVTGEVYVIEEDTTIKSILDLWNQGKKLDKKIMTQVLGTSYNKCNVQALWMSREIGLPPPFHMPTIQFE